MAVKESLPVLYEAVIAGHLVLCNRPLSISNAEAARGSPIQFLFCDEAVEELCSDWNWNAIPHYTETVAFIRGDGRLVLIQEPGIPFMDYVALVRYFLPFAAALQGFLILHASAVRFGDNVLAFIGPSGVGKSTVAKNLAGREFQFVADDLLPVSISGGRSSVFDPTISEQQGMTRDFADLFFLERDSSIDEPYFSRLTEQETVLALLHNGFGEMPDTAVWGMQFIAYGHLARTVPAFLLRIPDNLQKLPEMVQKVSQEIWYLHDLPVDSFLEHAG
ncbi:MAG: hypothetical protein ACK2U6_01640 [Candidatus Promineifilaceae bacterium]|jgi:hypothetical protein